MAHGTRSSYVKGCRCADCRVAQTAYMQAYRQRAEAKVARRDLKAKQRATRKAAGLPAVEYDAARRAAYQKRRAQKKSSAYADKVLAANVYDRDGWMCGICSEPVDPSLTYPDPMSASLDHVVPLSLGGEHTEANTRCSHLRCNVRRGNRVA